MHRLLARLPALDGIYESLGRTALHSALVVVSHNGQVLLSQFLREVKGGEDKGISTAHRSC